MFLTKHDSSITFDSKLEREREREIFTVYIQ